MDPRQLIHPEYQGQSIRYQIKLSASNAQSRKVWTSYGVTMSLFAFFCQQEVCEDQLLNKFFYDIAVSRV